MHSIETVECGEHRVSGDEIDLKTDFGRGDAPDQEGGSVTVGRLLSLPRPECACMRITIGSRLSILFPRYSSCESKGDGMYTVQT